MIECPQKVEFFQKRRASDDETNFERLDTATHHRSPQGRSSRNCHRHSSDSAQNLRIIEQQSGPRD